MALTIEWQHRIERWENALWKACYHPLGSISFSGFTTLEQLTPRQALAREFKPMPEGTPWGGKWEYGWFKGSLTLPPEAAGKRIVLEAKPGDHCEGTIYINGKVSGSIGSSGRNITLSKNGQPGQTYAILIEAYAGHGRTTAGEGPVLYGVETVPEPPPTQKVVGASTFGIWREEVYQAAIDFTTLH
jgi:alpha-mannosidase